MPKTISEQQKKKISIALMGNTHGKNNKGKKRTAESRLKTSKSMIGKRNGAKSNFWKGGISKPNNLLRASVKYRKWRLAVFERDNWTCIWCGQRGGKLNADHIKSFAYHPEVRFDISNGRTLCLDCHKTTPNYAKNKSF